MNTPLPTDRRLAYALTGARNGLSGFLVKSGSIGAYESWGDVPRTRIRTSVRDVIFTCRARKIRR